MKKFKTVAIIGLIILLCVSVYYNYKQYQDAKNAPIREIVTTVEIREKTDSAPTPVSEKEVGAVYVAVKPEKKSSETNAAADSVDAPMTDTLTMQGDSVRIPITQKVYEDTMYTAYVSGYRPSLDSITVRERTVTTTITQTRYETDFRRWNIGLTAGYGYGIKGKQLDWFIGIGITMNVFPQEKKRR